MGGVRRFQCEIRIARFGGLLFISTVFIENIVCIVLCYSGLSKNIESLYAYNSIFSVIASVGLFCFFSYKSDKNMDKKQSPKILSSLAGETLFVYLIDSSKLGHTVRTSISLNVCSILLYYLVIFSVSFCLTKCHNYLYYKIVKKVLKIEF